jgi:hypothetical protein
MDRRFPTVLVAKLQRSDRGCGRDILRPKLRHDPRGGSLRELWQLRPRFRRWPSADAEALLHQWRGVEVHASLTACFRRNAHGRAW